MTPGTRIGAYEIVGKIGEGGMGEVYRARDAHLQRDVALKALPAEVSADPERLARLRREAQLLASLDHPNIAQVHGLEGLDGDGRPRNAVCIVMEFVDGQDLAERMSHGPIPLDDALPIARQVAAALDAAHERGVVHRDLKPANIKVRPDGTVKVLDFGLAKAFEPDADSQLPSVSRSPTLSSPAMTRAGIILGTAAYMAPEQARGKRVDKRADIWAFGVVLLEMLTGERLFGGGEVSDTLAFVLTKEPDWTKLPAATPASIRRLLRRCLQKDRNQRLADIGDARLDIDDALKEPAGDAVAAPAAPRAARWWIVAPWGIALFALAALAAVLVWAPSRIASAGSFLVERAEPGANVIVPNNSGVSLAPDGSAIAFVGRSPANVLAIPFVYLRRLDRLDAQQLPGTERASAPFFSRDGAWIAFFADGALKKVPAGGGGAVVICQVPSPRGGWWADDDAIVFASDGGLFRVPSGGGTPEQLFDVKPGERPPSAPQVLPGGRAVLYFEYSSSDPDKATIVARTLPHGPRKVVREGGALPRYASSGHLLYVRNAGLFAAPFDSNALEIRGGAVPVLDTGSFASIGMSDANGRGALAFVPNTTDELAAAPLMWLDKTTGLQPLRAAPLSWGFPRFSPDGRRLAMTVWDGKQADIWIYDWERDILTRFTSDPGNDLSPVWMPDGSHIVFASDRDAGGAFNLYVQRADAIGGAQRLTSTSDSQLPDSVHPNGKTIVFHQGDPRTSRQALLMVDAEHDAADHWTAGTPRTFVGGDFLKANPNVSPDGRWVAYAAADSGRWEIYVQPFSGQGGRVQISSGGGNLAVWSPVKPELYYAASGGQQQMMVVPYRVTGDTFTPEKARAWSPASFSADPPVAAYGPHFDIHPDGSRFVVAPRATPAAQSVRGSQIVTLFNLYDGLRRIAPVAK